ncbi:ATP-dependent RNA helicase dhx37, partial [Perkinsus olseni]
MTSTGQAEEEAPSLFDPSLLGLDADIVDSGGSNTLIMEAHKSAKKKAHKDAAAPKEKMSKRKRKKLMELQERAAREARRLAVLDELKTHQLSAAEKAKMHAVADAGVRKKRRED